MRLLVFGQSMSDDYLYRLIQAGAHGYFNEKMTGEHIIQAFEAVSRGEYWVERHIMQRFISEQSILNDINTRVRELGERLTPRELEVLELVLQGLSTGEIAERIFLSHQGVKAHLTTLFRKFNVKNRSQLILSSTRRSEPGRQYDRPVPAGPAGLPPARAAIGNRLSPNSKRRGLWVDLAVYRSGAVFRRQR